MKYLYVIISRTHTRFGGVVRHFSKSYFNHAAIAFDESLTEWYAFARAKKSNLLSARLIKENLSRYVSHQGNVDCRIYKIPVTEKQLASIKSLVSSVYRDKEYIYNYTSILTYPVLKGIRCYKTFTCVEFVSFLLEKLEVPLYKESNKISPDELAKDLTPFLFYKGDLGKYVKRKRKVYEDKKYFKRFGVSDILDAVQTIRLTRKKLIW